MRNKSVNRAWNVRSSSAIPAVIVRSLGPFRNWLFE
jgi:hypothetical protein